MLARSAFHHSMNYRSVVVYGRAERVDDDDEKRAALEAIVEHVVAGQVLPYHVDATLLRHEQDLVDVERAAPAHLGTRQMVVTRSSSVAASRAPSGDRSRS